MAKSLGSAAYMQNFGHGKSTDNKVAKRKKLGRVGGKMRGGKMRMSKYGRKRR